MANIFDPNEFFQKTAYYASQGRGLFTLTKLPTVLTKAGYKDNSEAWNLCTKGLMAKSISTPGYNLATFEEFSYIGPTRKHAHTQIFGPITVEFFLMGQTRDEAESLFELFTVWQEQIAGARFAAGEIARGSRSDSTFFAIEYYNNYVSEATIQIFSPHINATEPSNSKTAFTDIDKTPTPVISIRYYEVWPQAISGFNTSWESQDAPMTLSVTFEYFHALRQS
jgi:hypothetical protein